VREFRIPNVVVDPVMVAKSGDPLLSEEARAAIRDRLIPLADIIPPNLFEAETLLGREIRGIDGMKDAARRLVGLGCKWVALKGGRSDIDGKAVDVLCNGKELELLISPWMGFRNTQGAGCTFASAIAAGLAKGHSMSDAVKLAKEYISEAIRGGPEIGKGRNPVNHMIGTKGKW
jgi:hydroxymethylpyrimidine/phosphomethylpyrimidine kinase